MTIGQRFKGFVKVVPIPHGPAVDPLRLRHPAISDHLVEQGWRDTNIAGRLHAREATRLKRCEQGILRA